MIGPGEAGRRLGVSTRTVQRWVREGRLLGVRVGGRTRIDEASLEHALRAAWPAAGAGRERSAPSIRRLVVANRGELVVRIARTCRGLGISCVALAPPDQVDAWWSRQADAVVRLEGTYLDADAVLRASRAAGADALHPGYGFLAESAAFAEQVLEAGMRWVGPPPAAMRALGDKAAARRVAARLGVPILTGYEGDDQADERLAREAERIGFPVLAKPSAGGGGKGMHIIHGPEEVPELLARARREARTAFGGDDRLVLERYVARPRHVEIQLLIDGRGEALALGERDCTLQRRHQKVIEEAPSPVVGEALRRQLQANAMRLALEVGYVGAGTVEFLIDEHGTAYFLELNARLQVEHPVTELVTGRDLVADQLTIAAGAQLEPAPAPRVHRDAAGTELEDAPGHAVEARLYAEDPWAGFVPATGSILGVRWPTGPGVRVDAGVGEGDTVGTRYDPLLAKVIARGRTRDEALDRLSAALDETSVLGVTTNRGFLRHLVDLPQMRNGEIHTGSIAEHWHPDPSGAEDAVALEQAWVAGARAIAATLGAGDPVPAGFRLNAPTALRLAIGELERTAPVQPGRDAVPGPPAHPVSSGFVLDLDGRAVTVRLALPPSTDVAAARAIRAAGGVQRVVAPMPGTVTAVRVRPGDEVEPATALVVLEAMKMENAVTAPAAARVRSVLVEPGQQVTRGEPLVELE